jgi:hypothetical protein
MKILKKKDQAECIGYLLADYKRPYQKLRVSVDAINFPMTTKLKNKRLADKPPLPPHLPLKNNGPESKYKDLRERI